MIDIVATLTRSEADIQVVHDAYGGMRYFKPLSERAHEWMDENLADESTFLHGELVVELRYADDLMEGLASDGMVFSCRSGWTTRPRSATAAMSR